MVEAAVAREVAAAEEAAPDTEIEAAIHSEVVQEDQLLSRLNEPSEHLFDSNKQSAPRMSKMAAFAGAST